MLGELAALAVIIYGAKKLMDYNKRNKEKQEQKNNNEIHNDSNNGSDHKNKPGIAFGILDLNCEEASAEKTEYKRQYICESFGCEFQCTNMKKLKKPDKLAAFRLFDRTYNGYNTLIKTKLETIENGYSFQCDRINRYMDKFGESVVAFVKDIPCFDSGDRMYDSRRSLYFFQNKSRIAALYCAEGYQISELYVFENLHEFDEQLTDCLRNNEFHFNERI